MKQNQLIKSAMDKKDANIQYKISKQVKKFCPSAREFWEKSVKEKELPLRTVNAVQYLCDFVQRFNAKLSSEEVESKGFKNLERL